MNNKILTGVLRAPENDEGAASAGGGGDGGDSHEAAAAKLFAGSSGDSASPPPAGEGGGEKKAPAAAPAGDGKATPAASSEVKPGILGRIAKKPEAAAPAGEKKPGEAAPTEFPEDKIKLSEKAAPETTKHFETVKGITKQLRSELTARDARIKELEAKVSSGTALPADYEKLKTEHKAFSERVAILDVQSHPDFVRQFTEPKAKITAALNTVLSDNQVAGTDISALLAKPRAEFMKGASEIAEKLPEYERFEFLSGARQLYQIAQQERDALGKASELAQGFKAKTLEVQREAFSKTWEKLGGMSEFLLKIDVDPTASPEEKASIEAFNAAVDGVRTAAERNAFTPAGEEGAAQQAIKAATLDFFLQHAVPRMEAEYRQLTDLVTKLQAEVTSLRGQKGEAAGTGGGGDGAARGEGDMSHEEAARKTWGGG